MRWAPRLNFSTKLLLHLSIVILVMFALSGYVTYRIHTDLFTEEVSKQFSKANEQAASRLDLQIRDIYRISNSIVFNPYVEQVLRRSAMSGERAVFTQVSDQDELNELLFQVEHDENKLYSMFLFDLKHNGFFFSGAANAPGFLPKELYEEAQQRLIDTMGNFIWFPSQVPSLTERSGKRNVFVAARLMKNTSQDRFGTLIMLFEESLFSEDLRELTRDEKANVFLYDKQDLLVYSDLVQPNEAIGLQAIDYGNRSVHEHDGESFLYVKSRSGDADFTLVSRVSLSALKEKSTVTLPVTMAVLVVGLLITAVLVTITGKRLLKPIHKLVIGMRRIQEGDLNVKLEVQSEDELAFIGRSFNSMSEHMKQLIQEVYERQLNEREAELTALQSQLNPHFMYNTLDTLYWKLYLKDDRDNANLVVSLSEMLRYTLEPANVPTTLHEEMEQIRNYLTIQNTRFGDGLETIVQSDPRLGSIQVPRLILQPIVENVFTHAFQDKTSGKVLIIKAYIRTVEGEQEALCIEVTDNGKGMTSDEIGRVYRLAKEQRHALPALMTKKPNERRRLPIGVTSVIRRLTILYGPPYGLQFQSRPGKGTTVLLLLPKEMEA